MEIKETRKTLNTYCAKHGAIIGGVLILLAFIFYLKNGKLNDPESYAGTANTIMLVLGLLFFTKKYRDDNKIGFLNFKKAFKISFIIGFYAAILFSFFIYLFYKFSPEAMQQFFLTIQNAYQATGALSGDDIETMLEIAQKLMTPGYVAFTTLFGVTIEISIFSLIIAFFMSRNSLQRKKETSAFDRDMSDLNN
ncbi:MAG: DUF4199 domain-containing protein [Salinivirgaceae bacterium]|nr:DUF4199 domain-containing protein [Salinivirgaceae bacterium]MDD4746910.1 DUF4199 domain-containing protein [Salinivirgaceae bacterium]MDY0279489.1 DUF4199 domain-containing protein [Salinivirgaceae bacterium]